MVRRWSYINDLNFLPSQDIYKVRVGTMDVVVNARMYLRRDYPSSTLNYRKGWARRKHTNDLLFLSNIMIVWAKEYRFYRNYNRSLFYQNFFRNTYLSFNLHMSKHITTRYTKANVSAVGSGWNASLGSYFLNQGFSSRYNTTHLLSGFNWSYASFIKSYTKSNVESYQPGTHFPFLCLGEGVNSPLAFEDSGRYSSLSLFSVIEKLYWSWLTSLYGILVKLFWFRLV